jgi:hypothetical protein
MPEKVKELAAGRLVLSIKTNSNPNPTKDFRLAMSSTFALAQHNQIFARIAETPPVGDHSSRQSARRSYSTKAPASRRSVLKYEDGSGRATRNHRAPCRERTRRDRG